MGRETVGGEVVVRIMAMARRWGVCSLRRKAVCVWRWWVGGRRCEMEGLGGCGGVGAAVVVDAWGGC